MGLNFQSIQARDFLSPFYQRKMIDEAEFKAFKAHLETYKQKLEENEKQNEPAIISNALQPLFKALDFDARAGHKQKNNSQIDLVLLKDNEVSVLIEAKKPDNKKEAFSPENVNCKALQEAILYYFRLRKQNHSSIKFIILTNFYHFYIFKAREFEKLFYENKDIQKFYENFISPNSLYKGNTEEFYKEISKILDSKSYQNFLEAGKENLFDKVGLKGLHLDIKTIKSSKNSSFKPFFKVFNTDFLLDEFHPNDANTLNVKFYNELLYILGLCESKQNSKILITPSKESEALQGTLYYNILSSLEPSAQDTENVMQLLILWLNRILFLKLIETNLVRFNHNDKSLKFLNKQKINDFDKLSELFFDILAKKYDERNKNSVFASLPYLNSSLFEKQSIEKELLDIAKLKNDLSLNYYDKTQIKDKNSKQKSGKIDFLAYLFEFLDSFDFGLNEALDHEENIFKHKELINSSVLGLVFEKLNGYKEGSFYTPNFITSFMCKESLEKVVLNKFNETFKQEAKNLTELQENLNNLIKNNKVTKEEFKKLLQSIKICDPAVGSGHFLVSALNEMMIIYDRLNLIEFRNEYKFIECALSLENGELIIKYQNKFFEYTRPNSESESAQIIQKTLFELKKDIIENNLFGVDINANSCNIARLRLWIELLKNSYYENLDEKSFQSLSTLPNIDINIKCGNSLVSYVSIKKSLYHYPDIKNLITNYKENVKSYKNQNLKDERNKAKETIQNIQTILNNESISEKLSTKLRTKCRSHNNRFGVLLNEKISKIWQSVEFIDSKAIQQKLFGKVDLKEINENTQNEAEKSYLEINKIKEQLELLKSKKHYKNSMEWRFEFPEALDDEGNFLGFDLIIGNPPYIRHEVLGAELKQILEQNSKDIYDSTSDIYTYFFELGFKLLKPKGILNLITSNKYCRARYGEKLREFLLTNFIFLSYIDLNGIKVFESATVDTSIIKLYKYDTQAKNKKEKAKEIANLNNEFFYLSPKTQDLKDINYNLNALKEKGFTLPQTSKSLSKESFIFTSPQIAALKQKIEKIGTALKKWDITINYGIKTGYNEAFIIDTAKKDEILNACDASEKSELDGLSERERTSKLIKPILRGRDIKRYGYEWAGLWLIGTFPALKLNIDDYPVLKNYLASFGKRLEQSGEKNIDSEGNNARKKTGNKWFETQDNIAYYKEFAREKIIYPNMASEFVAFLDKNAYLTNQKCFILTQNNIKQDRLLYLNAILNSKLNFWYFKQIGAKLGATGYEMSKIFVERLPVRKNISKSELEKIELCVKEILELKSEDKNTQDLETKLDEMIYQIYKLDENEISLIEKEFADNERERERERKFLRNIINNYDLMKAA